MINGFIVLHRKILDNPIAKNEGLLSLFIHLLLMASHKESRFLWNGKEETLKRGQLMTGRLKLAEIMNTNQSTIYKRLRVLGGQGLITIKSNNKFSVITIVKYSQYQDMEIKGNNKVTTKEQQSNTYNNVNNETTITNVIGKPLDKRNPDVQIIWDYGLKVGLGTTKQNLNRYAIKRLLKNHTVDQLLKAMEVAQEIRQEPYAPQINNWMDLEDKYLKLRDFFARQQSKKPKIINLNDI